MRTKSPRSPWPVGAADYVVGGGGAIRDLVAQPQLSSDNVESCAEYFAAIFPLDFFFLLHVSRKIQSSRILSLCTYSARDYANSLRVCSHYGASTSCTSSATAQLSYLDS